MSGKGKFLSRLGVSALSTYDTKCNTQANNLYFVHVCLSICTRILFIGCCAFDEAGAKAAIIDVLEELICGDNPQLVLEKIKTEDNVPSVCGRVFKIGEPTYSCRECSKYEIIMIHSKVFV